MRNFEIADYNGTFLPDDEDEWDECSHTLDCSCETCMQNYPERFDEDWNNIYWIDPEEAHNDTGR